LAYKGPGINDEILFSENAIEMLGGELTGIKEVEVPFSKKTYNIVIIKKRKQIPDKYPRSSNKIKKSPL
jgi:16S rRNA (guanine527-N7)-methyltransferase